MNDGAMHYLEDFCAQLEAEGRDGLDGVLDEEREAMALES